MLDSTAVPSHAVRKLAVIGDRHAKAVALAHEQGVTIAMGTDIALSGAELIDSWGRNGRDCRLVQSGLSPMEAIQAATFNGPLTLGPRRPAAASSPRATTPISSSWTATHWPTSPSWPTPHIVGVWKAGRRVRGHARTRTRQGTTPPE